MDSQEKFKQLILDYYKNIAGDRIPLILLEKLSDNVTEYYYEQYSRFRGQYPKSTKRYSTFQIKDLDHPETFEIIIKFFKDKYELNYKERSCLLLKMTEKELADFEKNRVEFYNMF